MKMKIILAIKDQVFWVGAIKVLENEPGMDVVGVCYDGYTAINKSVELGPDVILIDEDIQDCGCLELSQRIKEQVPKTRLVIFSKALDLPTLFLLRRAGAWAYLEKDISPTSLVFSVNHVGYRGGVIISPPMAEQLIKELTQGDQSTGTKFGENKFELSKREFEILALVAGGASNKEISSALFISVAESTVIFGPMSQVG